MCVLGAVEDPAAPQEPGNIALLPVLHRLMQSSSRRVDAHGGHVGIRCIFRCAGLGLMDKADFPSINHKCDVHFFKVMCGFLSNRMILFRAYSRNIIIYLLRHIEEHRYIRVPRRKPQCIHLVHQPAQSIIVVRGDNVKSHCHTSVQAADMPILS